MSKRIRQRIDAVSAWYDIARSLAFDELERQRRAMTRELQNQCKHELLPWQQVEEEGCDGWSTRFDRHCKWCDLTENQKECPAGLDYTPVVKSILGVP